MNACRISKEKKKLYERANVNSTTKRKQHHNLKINWIGLLRLEMPENGPIIWWCSGKESACHCRRCKKCGFDPCVRKTPWGWKWQFTPVFLQILPGRWSLAGYRLWGHKDSDMTEWLSTQFEHKSVETI